MKFLPLLALLPSALALVVPRATTTSNASASATPTLVPTGPEYYLKTKLVESNDTAKAKYDGLYLVATHTGAGLNDAVFTSNKSIASKGFLNATSSADESYSYQEFDLGNYWPYGLELGYEAYTAWSPVTINAGYGDNGFEFQPDGLVYNSTEFGGWLVCDWWHSEPQLFWINSYYTYTLPTSCAHVYLIKESV